VIENGLKKGLWQKNSLKALIPFGSRIRIVTVRFQRHYYKNNHERNHRNDTRITKRKNFNPEIFTWPKNMTAGLISKGTDHLH